MSTDNTLPSGIHPLMNLGGSIADALKLHGPWLKMTQTPEAAFRAMLERLRNAEALYGDSRAAKTLIGKESTAADKALTQWLVRTKSLLMTALGHRWSERWLEVGGMNGRTAIPKRMQPRIELATGMIRWLEKHPSFAIPSLNTDLEGSCAIRDRLVTAQRELRAAKADGVVKKRARDAAERALRRKMRQVVVILGVTLRAEDQRWLDFGLNRPLRSLGTRPAERGARSEADSVLPVSFATESADEQVGTVAA